MLDDVPYALVKQLAKYVRGRQLEKSPFSRSTTFVATLLQKHAAWLEQEDIPSMIIRKFSREPFKKELSGLKSSPETPTKVLPRVLSFTTPTKLNPSRPLSSTMPRRDVFSDDVFLMDEQDVGSRPSSSRGGPIGLGGQLSPAPTWKATAAPKYVLYFLQP